MKSMNTLEDLFVHELKDILHAEKQLVKALPRMAKAASSDKLRSAIEEHFHQTEGQVQRLERVFRSLEVTPKGLRCAAMEGLLEEGKQIMEEHCSDEVRDAALICAAQKVEHYEIASYGTLVAFAQRLGHSEAEKLLKQTLDEEKETDRRLTMLAESEINAEAQTHAAAGSDGA